MYFFAIVAPLLLCGKFNRRTQRRRKGPQSSLGYQAEKLKWFFPLCAFASSAAPREILVVRTECSENTGEERLIFLSPLPLCFLCDFA
jgi:hypothetical protein